MAEPLQSTIDIEQLVELDELRDWIQEQRWYASKSRNVSALEIVENVVLRHEPPLVLALVQARFATGTHELYQLPIGMKRFDALTDPTAALELLRRIDSGEEIETSDGQFGFHRANGVVGLGEDANARLMGVEQ